MPDDIKIRPVTVEFLRHGPPHNQLLSPLTQYLAMCGDAGAGTVTVPYEHARFERRLRALRYESGDSEDRLATMHEIGAELGSVLAAVPGLTRALGGSDLPSMIHLRLTLSASELALLPFEMAKVPGVIGSEAANWLAIQTRPPVCITRNSRAVSPESVTWSARPRILFISGDPRDVPFEEHRRALISAIDPFRHPNLANADLDRHAPTDTSRTTMPPAREEVADLLTILVTPTLQDVFRECRDARYTHVHILTHGDAQETSPGTYGLVFGSEDTHDVVAGDRLCNALTSVANGRVHRPTVVTLGSCDSGNVGSVVLPDASVAHALHEAGIPLVIGSQFPLSMEASVPLAASFYSRILWGEHPLIVLQQLRAELHAGQTAAVHDWASLVVYEALPVTLERQLEEFRVAQIREALNVTLECMDLAMISAAHDPQSLRRLVSDVERGLTLLPTGGQYAVECLGLRASAYKRLAQAIWLLPGPLPTASGTPHELLHKAWLAYRRAADAILMNELQDVQRVATLHWVLVQVLSLSAVLGKDAPEGMWGAAKMCAELYVTHADAHERAWAHGSLAELWLLRLSEAGLLDDQKRQYADRALHHAQELGEMFPWDDEFRLMSTRRQLARYIDWWGSERFEAEFARRGAAPRARWDGDWGLKDAARRMLSVLRRAPADHGAPPARSGPSETGDGSEPMPTGARDQNAHARDSRGALAPSVPRPARASEKPFFDVEMLPAGHGDCLWIEYGRGGSTHRWLVDCGTQGTARDLLARVDEVPRNEQMLELFVLTHIDADHIGGALPFFKAVQRGLRFGDVWFNGWRQLRKFLGPKQGEMFSTAIQDFELPWNVWRDGAAIVVEGDELPVHELPGGMKLTLLSPGPAQLKKLGPEWIKELKRQGLEPGARVDYRRFLRGTPSTSTDVDELADTAFSSDAASPNGTSIALLAEYEGAAVLLGADAHAPVLVGSIRKLLRQRGTDRLELDAFKVSHHASQNNLSKELLDLLDCGQYLISTSGAYFTHPDREAIGRILKYGGQRPRLHFNYKTQYNDVWARPDLQEKYGYTTVYPAADRQGLTVPLLADE